MATFTNAKHMSSILSETPVFHIVITGHDEKTGIMGFSWHNEHPHHWLINKVYRQPLIRHMGAIEFRFYDYSPKRNEWFYFHAATQVLRHEGLAKS